MTYLAISLCQSVVSSLFHTATPEESRCKNQEKWQVWPVAITTRVMSLAVQCEITT